MKRITKIETTQNRTKKKFRVAAYARVSTDSAEQLASLSAQKEHYDRYIKSNPEWEYAGLYYDEGITGTKIDKRDGLLRLISDCENGLIDYIIVKSISRFSRNTVDSLETVRHLCEIGVFIYFEKENIDTLDVKGEVLLTIMASLAQQESESLSLNVKLGIQYRNQKGKVQINHNRFLGYTKDEDGKLVIVPEEAEIVRRIYTEYLEGKSLLTIRRSLEADGIRNGAGNLRWHESNLKQILANERDAVKADEIGNEIITLREEKQKLLTDGALEQDRIERFEDMKKFLDEQNDFLTEYSDALTRRLVEKVTVYDEKVAILFRSGLEIEIAA